MVNCSLFISRSLVANDSVVNNSGKTETITYSTSSGTRAYTINCIDSHMNEGNASGFITITPPPTTSGGGGSSATTRISLNIEVPSPMIVYETGKIEIPISVKNTGERTFREINLNAYVLEEGKRREDINVRLDTDFFTAISPGISKSLTASLILNEDKITSYEVVINATAVTPKYDTSKKVSLSFIGKDASGVKKMIIFTEDMIVNNPQCLDLQEMIDEAKRLSDEGRYEKAIAKSQEAVEACKASIEGVQRPISQPKRKFEQWDLLIYLAIAMGAAILLGVLFNLYKTLRFRKKK